MTNFDLENLHQAQFLQKFPSSINNLLIAGVDEAGRGPLAGPVVAAAVIVNRNYHIEGIKDSKKLNSNKRAELYEQIISKYIYSISVISPQEIDIINILEATKKACILAVENLSNRPDLVLIDGNMKFKQQNFISIVKGDDLSYSIAAASIVAKVSRDKIMMRLNEEFPCYHWDQNFGYGTKKHMEAIITHGLSLYHRKTFRNPLKT